jgi:hypothetical protein
MEAELTYDQIITIFKNIEKFAKSLRKNDDEGE